MLRKEVSGTWVKRARHEITRKEVKDWPHAKVVNHRCIKRENNGPVQRVPFGKLLLLDHHGANSIEDDLADCEENFAQHVGQEDTFKFGGEIGVDALQTLVLVVLQVIALECGGVRNCDRKVGEKKPGTCYDRSF